MKYTESDLRLMFDTEQTIWRDIQECPSEVDCLSFIFHYMRKHKITMDGTILYDNNDDVITDCSLLFYKVFLEYREFKQNAGFKVYKFNERDVGFHFGLLSEKQWKAKRSALRKKLESIPNKQKYDLLLEKLCQHLFGKKFKGNKTRYNTQKAFIAHWMWQVLIKIYYGAAKAQAFGHESMLVLFSPEQKTGKSTFCRWLLEPFLEAGFVWKADFLRLEDKFSLGNLGENYVAFFDEMARASGASICKIKQLVTDDEVTYRNMFSHKETRMPKLATMLGTTNNSCRTLFNDTTGLRRFHEVAVNGRAEGGIELDALKDFPYLDLYRSLPLDPNKSPLFDYITADDLVAYEDYMRPLHVIEAWMGENGITLSTEPEQGQMISSKVLFINFSNWAGKNGFHKNFLPNIETFNRKLEELGALKHRTSRIRGFIILLEPEHTLEGF